MRDLFRKVYKQVMFALIGFTGFLSQLELEFPGKWCYMVENIAAISHIAHCKLSGMEEEVSEDYIEKEEIIEKKIGRRKFYSEEELGMLKEKRKEVRI